ncbi:hypothetical protein [uncultured Flavobacterium sp.]|uniref:hypothetical protein n=1 Tax=uncultured Flavobacterium sp. TaxID=165435 RepID=UPI0025E71496|nr:hypothetical protein [uncultured Flavobacterium sp.]
MKKTILKSALYSSLLIAALTFSSCKKEGEADADATTATDTTEIMPESEAPNNPVMDTVVEKDGDTIVRTGGGKNDNPSGEQVP